MINKKDTILKVMNMKKTYKFLFQFILFAFFVFSSKSVYSSHIVGGEMFLSQASGGTREEFILGMYLYSECDPSLD